MGTDSNFNETSLGDLVYAILSPILNDFLCTTGRWAVRLLRKKDIVSKDGETGSVEELVVVNLPKVKQVRYILVVRPTRSSLGMALKECLLAMKDMSEKNGGSVVYGFVTTGISWQMVIYEHDGRVEIKDEMMVLYYKMYTSIDKEKWMMNSSVLVDGMYLALSSVGVAINMSSL